MKQIFYKGMSLVEMLMAIFVLSLVMTGVTLYFIRMWPLQQFAIDSSQAQLRASESVTSFVKLIRNMRQSDAGEYALQGAGSGEIVFFADQEGDGVVERVRIFRSGTDLLMGIIEPTGSPAVYTAGSETTHVVVSDVRNGSGSYPSEIFRYYNNGNEVLSGTFPISEVRMVGIDLYVDINPSSSPEAAHFESFASIRNLSEYDRLQ